MGRSLPSRERGLKHLYLGNILRVYNVAPLAGAWIETLMGIKLLTKVIWSLPSRERGLKHNKQGL